LQYEEQAGSHTEVWFYDKQDLFITRVYPGEVPINIRDALSYSQAEAEEDYAEFNDRYKALAGPNEPKDTNNKTIVMITPASRGFNTWFAGAGDNITPTPPATGRGEGEPFYVKIPAEAMATASEESPVVITKSYRFSEPMEINDGEVTWKPVEDFCGLDRFSLGVLIAANTYESTPDAGNCDPVEVYPGSGVYMLVPATNGMYTVDLSTAKPCPAKDKDGMWDVDYNTGAITPALTSGRGSYNLFSILIESWLIKNAPMNNPLGVFDIEAYSTEYFHPAWELQWKIEKRSPGAHTGHVAGWILAFRRFTT
jgi:hypothetical protein